MPQRMYYVDLSASFLVEEEREAIARTYACPRCNAGVGHACLEWDKGFDRVVSMRVCHTGRYELGVAAGALPPLGRAARKLEDLVLGIMPQGR